MSFIPELTRFLESNGVIYTVRKYMLFNGAVMIAGVGECKRLRMFQVGAPEELSPYVPSSGFDSLEAWVAKINQFIKPGLPWYLYKVTVTRKHERSK